MVDSAWRELSANFRSSGAQSCVDQTARKTHSFRDYVTVLFFCVYTVITFRNLLLSESFLSSWRILPEGQTEAKGKYKKKKLYWDLSYEAIRSVRSVHSTGDDLSDDHIK